jgi:hypothetical protein
MSVLALDLPAPGDGWSAFLAGRGIEVVTDDIGRKTISRGHATMLFDEHAQFEVRKAELLRRADEQAEEFDRRRRAELFAGVPADRIPGDVPPSAWMLQAAHDGRPRRQSVLQHALRNEGVLEFHPLHGAVDDES